MPYPATDGMLDIKVVNAEVQLTAQPDHGNAPNVVLTLSSEQARQIGIVMLRAAQDADGECLILSSSTQRVQARVEDDDGA